MSSIRLRAAPQLPGTRVLAHSVAISIAFCFARAGGVPFSLSCAKTSAAFERVGSGRSLNSFADAFCVMTR